MSSGGTGTFTYDDITFPFNFSGTITPDVDPDFSFTLQANGLTYTMSTGYLEGLTKDLWISSGSSSFQINPSMISSLQFGSTIQIGLLLGGTVDINQSNDAVSYNANGVTTNLGTGAAYIADDLVGVSIRTRMNASLRHGRRVSHSIQSQ